MIVNRPFSSWGKVCVVLNVHSSHRYHQECIQDADILKTTIEKLATRIDVMADSAIQVRMNENKHIMWKIVHAVIFLAKQSLPFRGDVEDLNLSKKPGNFLALLKTFAETDKVLFSHHRSPRAKNATYISPRSRNEIINVIGYDVILANINAEIKTAQYFSVLADEVSCHNVEHLPICLRYVNGECNVREEFVAFVKLDQVRATDIADAIIECVENLGLSLSDLRGHGYDGAATISGYRAGVQANICVKQPKAHYTHCAGHSLNLAILNSCSVPPIRNCIDHIKSINLWIKYSAKSKGVLREVVSQGSNASSRASLLNIYITRWVENIDGWERFSLAHPFKSKCVRLCYMETIVFRFIVMDGHQKTKKMHLLT